MLIKLTFANRREFVYINPDHIGHCYRVPEETERARTIAEHTMVGVTTHNKETPEQIIKLIEKL